MRLNYFNARGLAETSRFLFAIAGEPYDDHRYPLKVIDWSLFKFERKEFEEDRDAGLLQTSLNKVPSLEANGLVISQSKAIERYLARRFGMVGDSEVQSAQVDAICEWVRDFKTEYQKTRALVGDDRDKGMAQWFDETLPERLAALDYLVGKDGYSVGSRTTLADVTLFTFLTQFFDNVEAATRAMDGAPNIKAVVDRISGLDNVQRWISDRPPTDF